jgi:hypothetical protein
MKPLRSLLAKDIEMSAAFKQELDRNPKYLEKWLATLERPNRDLEAESIHAAG